MDKGLIDRLNDARSRKVVFVSHCILNMNTRYLGGAFRKGGVQEIVDSIQTQGAGIIQIPCPERECWGGVLKPDLLRIYGAGGSWRGKMYQLLLGVWLWNLRRRYRKIAAQVVKEIHDYVDSGFQVLGIWGIDGSPTCGVNQTVDIKRFVAHISRLPVEQITTAVVNQIIEKTIIEGPGLFITALHNQLADTKLAPVFYAHDLKQEMKGNPASAVQG